MIKDNVKKLFFILLFTIVAFITQNINFSALVGTQNQFFTLFQFFGPIAGSFLGPWVGSLTVFLSEIANNFVTGKEFTLLNILRLLPMVVAAIYFGAKKKSLGIILPLLAIAAFIVHPVGRTVWFFSLYWTIPIIATLLPEKYKSNIFIRSLGTTFTAHAVGGAIWIYSIPMTAEQWIGLIPVVAYERLLFATGIAISYVAVNTLLDKIDQKWSIPVFIEKKYALLKSA
jgi:hypothetical protein